MKRLIIALLFLLLPGDVFVVKAGRHYELLSRNTMGPPLMATPALSQGMLIVRGENAVYALGGS